ncbi:MAG: anthranilate synthase component I [Synechococcales cyanobacterium T60_A2020_003]|nr:anthranilate synthase component I [Synechococcales cyanobacterium T60_A2020_003]
MTPVQPWVWRSLPLQQRSGSDIFAALVSNSSEIAVLLESPNEPPSSVVSPRSLRQYSICAGSPRAYQGRSQIWTPSMGQIFSTLKILHHRQQESTVPECVQHLPFTGGYLGWLGYDAAWDIEVLPYARADQLPFPVAFWYEPEWFTVLDHHNQVLWLAASSPAQSDKLEQQLEQSPRSDRPFIAEHGRRSPLTPQLAATQQDYETAVIKAKQYIRAGDIFQANLSLRFSTQTQVSSWDVYRALQTINPSPFASYWQTPWGSVMSCSPERLVQLRDRQAETRPIAGTRSRGITPEQDEQLAAELLDNRKENAEHIMLVDLERNDLGRVCEWGSVEVDELLTIERYSHVMHLVSNVKGTLHPDYDAIDLMRALFPGGTITGCPKVRCMEIIEELEPVRRSLFYGSCGYLDRRGNLDLNIFIRTLLAVPHRAGMTLYGQVGAGIVADSDPAQEWQESLHKAQAQLAALHHAESKASSLSPRV